MSSHRAGGGGATAATATASVLPPPLSRSHHRHDDAPPPPPRSCGRASSSTSPVRDGEPRFPSGRPSNAVRSLVAAARAALAGGRTPSEPEMAGLIRLTAAIPLSQLGLDDPAAPGRAPSPPALAAPAPAHSSEGSEGTMEEAASAAAAAVAGSGQQAAAAADLTHHARRLSLSDAPVLPACSAAEDDDGASSEDAMAADDDGRPAKRASPPRPPAEAGGGGRGGGAGAAAAAAPTPAHPPITYLHIAEDADVSLGVFCLPPGAVIPLHNHPGMTVVSRVLYGSLAVRSFDWADDDEGAGADDARPAPPRPAVLVADAVLTAASPPTVLRPAAGGNIHAFATMGESPTAVLDLLAPPYSGGDGGRDCTYFAEAAAVGAAAGCGGEAAPTHSTAAAAAAWPAPDPARPAAPGSVVHLAPVPAPAWFRVEHGTYRGARADGGAAAAGAAGRGTRRARE